MLHYQMHMAGKKWRLSGYQYGRFYLKLRRPVENYWSVDAELHPFAPESVDVKKQDFLAVVFVSVVENVTFNSENVFVVVVSFFCDF